MHEQTDIAVSSLYLKRSIYILKQNEDVKCVFETYPDLYL